MAVEMVDSIGEHLGMYKQQQYDLKNLNGRYVPEAASYSIKREGSYAGRSDYNC